MAKDGPCIVRITRDGKEVFNEEVPMGQNKITLKNQTGSGTVLYLLEFDGLDDKPIFVEFSK